MATGERSQVSVWLRPARTPRAAKGQAFTQDDLAATAVALADRDGLDVVSMRRVAADLGHRPGRHYLRPYLKGAGSPDIENITGDR